MIVRRRRRRRRRRARTRQYVTFCRGRVYARRFVFLGEPAARLMARRRFRDALRARLPGRVVDTGETYNTDTLLGSVGIPDTKKRNRDTDDINNPGNREGRLNIYWVWLMSTNKYMRFSIGRPVIFLRERVEQMWCTVFLRFVDKKHYAKTDTHTFNVQKHIHRSMSSREVEKLAPLRASSVYAPWIRRASLPCSPTPFVFSVRRKPVSADSTRTVRVLHRILLSRRLRTFSTNRLWRRPERSFLLRVSSEQRRRETRIYIYICICIFGLKRKRARDIEHVQIRFASETRCDVREYEKVACEQ